MDETQIKKNQDFLRDLYLAGFEKATAFMALIVTAGYAGAFTVWDHVESNLTYCERLLVAGFFTASLMLFVGWQIRGQWVLGQQQLAISKLVAAGVADFPALIDKFRADQAKLRGGLQRQLPIVFGATVTLGGIGSLLLLVACVRHLMIGHG
ncbi:MAG: hypothetical protein ACLPTF_18920 [Steroidobacteraceae bacterium]|jgi:hypothetical protein